MKYIDFKNAYIFETDLKYNLNSIKNTLFTVQRKFDEAYLSFFLDKDYRSALQYNLLFSNFKRIIENNVLNQIELLDNVLNIYKELIIKLSILKKSKQSTIRNINNNDLLSHSA